MRRQKFLLFRVYKFQDAKAYQQLYDFYFDKLYRYIYFKVPRPEDSEEITSEVFLRGWEYMTASKVEHAGALFYKIARNLVADFYRQRGMTEPLEQGQYVSAETLSEKIIVKQESEELIRALRQLKEEYRDVLVMRYLNEMSIKEIASVFEKTPNSVRVLLHRARKALREIATGSY
ncbi:RNA polymerase sigma factor [Patescibacteria group bacterium]|nr:RNA polymerase sigma factor [Patescibacteria group bacterium]